jgi:hypothetical protein
VAGGEPAGLSNGEALEPMPWRTDPVSSIACDLYPYADHAAINTMQQGVQRRHGPDPPKHLTL